MADKPPPADPLPENVEEAPVDHLKVIQPKINRNVPDCYFKSVKLYGILISIAGSFLSLVAIVGVAMNIVLFVSGFFFGSLTVLTGLFGVAAAKTFERRLLVAFGMLCIFVIPGALACMTYALYMTMASEIVLQTIIAAYGMPGIMALQDDDLKDHTKLAKLVVLVFLILAVLCLVFGILGLDMALRIGKVFKMPDPPSNWVCPECAALVSPEVEICPACGIGKRPAPEEPPPEGAPPPPPA